MAGLARICKMYGGMTVSDGKHTIKYVWDHVADKAVPETEMPLGSERWRASERKKWNAE